MTSLHQLIKFLNMQLAHRHDERPGESYEALGGKKLRSGIWLYSQRPGRLACW